ncbi:MAG: hypothetical protein GY710_20460 [Desulfobacteraceae bacterium]|nr:hypothetical protein [Desulfobacteraceae bacterium]
MADAIKQTFSLTPELIAGSEGIYDIEVDNKTIFSKHQTNRFPENDEIIKLLKNLS